MSDDNHKKPQTDNTAPEPQKAATTIRQKATAYPSMSIDDAISAVRQLKEKLGNGPYAREDIAKALGHSSLSGPASSKISACTQFGLLDRTGNAYRLSQLSFKIITPVDDSESSDAITEAVKRPQMYARLIAKFEGQALPQMLENIMAREYGISDNATRSAAANFEKSLTAAGILRNGIVNSHSYSEPFTEAESSQGLAPQIDHQMESAPIPAATTVTQGEISITIPDTGIRVIFPEEYAFRLGTGDFKDALTAIKNAAKGKTENGDE